MSLPTPSTPLDQRDPTNAPYRTSPRLAVDHLRRRGSKGDARVRSDVHVGAAPPAALDHAVAPISISTEATSDADFQSADAGGVDPDPRVALDDLREDVVAVWA